MTCWSPIETAPIRQFDSALWFRPHSDRLLLWNGHYADIGSYHFTQRGKGSWKANGRTASPTHWMPLPEPPK